jgi:hypothetical protein
MSDRADFIASIAASGSGSAMGIGGAVFGSFDYPYPDPSPPYGGPANYFFDSTLYDSVPSDIDDVSVCFCDECQASDGQDSAIPPQHAVQVLRELSEDSKQNLVRIADEARSEFGTSADKKVKHLEWAAKTLTPNGYAHYVRLVDIDHEQTSMPMSAPMQAEATSLPLQQPVLAARNLSESSKQNLVRIAKEAHSVSKGSIDKNIRHLEWAKTTFTPPGYACYVQLFDPDLKIRNHKILPKHNDETGHSAAEAPVIQPNQDHGTKEQISVPKQQRQRTVAVITKKKVTVVTKRRKERTDRLRKEGFIARLARMGVKRNKFEELVKLSKQKVDQDNETQKQLHQWARTQLSRDWRSEFNARRRRQDLLMLVLLI